MEGQEEDINGLWAPCVQLLLNYELNMAQGTARGHLWCVTLNGPGRNSHSHLVPPLSRFLNKAGGDERGLAPPCELSACQNVLSSNRKNTLSLLCCVWVSAYGHFLHSASGGLSF